MISLGFPCLSIRGSLELSGFLGPVFDAKCSCRPGASSARCFDRRRRRPAALLCNKNHSYNYSQKDCTTSKINLSNSSKSTTHQNHQYKQQQQQHRARSSANNDKPRIRSQLMLASIKHNNLRWKSMERNFTWTFRGSSCCRCTCGAG